MNPTDLDTLLIQASADAKPQKVKSSSRSGFSPARQSGQSRAWTAGGDVD